MIHDAPSSLSTRPAFCSWSGGKDCCLSLHEAADAGVHIQALVTMLIESGQRSRSHGLHRSILEAQAAAMGLTLHTAATSWADYETTFVRTISALAKQGLTTGVFGDIEGDANRQWELDVCAKSSVTAMLPVWHRPRAQMMQQIFDRGIEPCIVAVRDGVLPRDLLGQIITPAIVTQLERHGVDICGENGEYHTVVVNAPLFQHRINLQLGDHSLRSGVWYVDLALAA